MNENTNESNFGNDPKEFEAVMRAANHPWVKDWDRERDVPQGNFDRADEESDVASLDPTRPAPANYGVCKGGVLHRVLPRTPISLLGEDDFVFIDEKFDPYFVHNTARSGEPEVWWLHYWHSHAREWITLRKITELEREAFRLRAIASDHAELYFAP